MEIELKKCNRCKMNLMLDEFKLKQDGTYEKRCIECNKKNCEYYNYNTDKCEHEKRRSRCKECKNESVDGGSFCEHGKIRIYCKECKNEGIGGNGICVHVKRQKQMSYL